MKVLYIGNFLKHVTNGYSGPNIHLVDILRKSGHDVLTSGSSESKLLRSLDFLFSVFKSNFNGTQIIFVDVFSTRAFNFAYYVAFLAWLFGIPYVIILHGGDLPERFESDRRRSLRLLKYAKAIVSPSSYLASEVSKRFGLNVDIIPNFIEVEQWNGNAKDNFHILWVRSISMIYNPQMALDVMIHLLENDRRYKLTMIGPGLLKDFEFLNNLIKEKGLDKYIDVTGKMERNKWHIEGLKAGFFINTTTIDNTPSSVLEAISLGMVTISTNVGGIPYILEDGITGILVANGCSQDMAEGIISLNENIELRERIRKQAFLFFERNYTQEVIYEKWLIFLKKYFD